MSGLNASRRACTVFLRLLCVPCFLCLLSGCAPLLERTYAVSEPHSSRFWESEAAGTLRAESYQDIVNDLLLLIGQHTENAALRLYNFTSDFSVADTLEQATTEIQQDTPMGAYAVEYITAVSQAQRGYYEVAVKISYRRSLEQIQAVVNATSPEALYSLLCDALDNEKSELAVRIGYWGPDGFDQLNDAVWRVREEFGLADSADWIVNFFPSQEAPGLVEFLLEGQELPSAGLQGNNGQNAGSQSLGEPPPDRDSLNGDAAEIPGAGERTDAPEIPNAGGTAVMPEIPGAGGIAVIPEIPHAGEKTDATESGESNTPDGLPSPDNNDAPPSDRSGWVPGISPLKNF